MLKTIKNLAKALVTQKVLTLMCLFKSKPKLKNLVRTAKTHKGFSKQKGSVVRIRTTFFLLQNFTSVQNLGNPVHILTYLPIVSSDRT